MATPNETNSGPSGESATLLHTALFKQVSSEEAEELLPHLQHAEYNKGDYIFREGDTDHRMYLLERGRVKLIRQSSDRRVQLLSIHAYGEVLGEIPVFDPHGGPRTASAVAMTSDTKVVWLEHDALFAWLDEHPRVAVDMLQVLAHRMRDNNERISELVFMDVPGRFGENAAESGITLRRAGRGGVEGAARSDAGGNGAAGRFVARDGEQGADGFRQPWMDCA